MRFRLLGLPRDLQCRRASGVALLARPLSGLGGRGKLLREPLELRGVLGRVVVRVLRRRGVRKRPAEAGGKPAVVYEEGPAAAAATWRGRGGGGRSMDQVSCQRLWCLCSSYIV